MKSYYVYTITNIVNKKVYVGITNCFKKRRWQHLSRLNRGVHKNKPLQKDYTVYGKDTFVFKCIDECIEEEKDVLERFYIDKFKSNQIEFGYNLTNGGMSGFKFTDDKRREMSERALTNAKPVVMLNSNGDIVAKYKNAKYASKNTGIGYTCILKCCNGVHSQVKGIQWCYEEDLHSRVGVAIPLSKRFRQVVKLSLNGEYIDTYDRIADTLKELGVGSKDGSHLSGCCSGRRCSFKGFIWLYLDEYTEENVKKRLLMKKKAMTNEPKSVLLLNEDFSIKERYATSTIASRSLQLSGAAISTACNKQRPTKSGLILVFEKDYEEFIQNRGGNNE